MAGWCKLPSPCDWVARTAPWRACGFPHPASSGYRGAVVFHYKSAYNIITSMRRVFSIICWNSLLWFQFNWKRKNQAEPALHKHKSFRLLDSVVVPLIVDFFILILDRFIFASLKFLRRSDFLDLCGTHSLKGPLFSNLKKLWLPSIGR